MISVIENCQKKCEVFIEKRNKRVGNIEEANIGARKRNR